MMSWRESGVGLSISPCNAHVIRYRQPQQQPCQPDKNIDAKLLWHVKGKPTNVYETNFKHCPYFREFYKLGKLGL